MKNRKKIIEKILVYGGVLALIGGLYLGAKAYASMSQARLENIRAESASESEESDQRTRVKVCGVFYQPLKDVLRLPGTVEAYTDIDLAARQGGTVKWIGPEEGDYVEKGEKLLEIDTALIEARLEQAETAYELAEAKFERIKDLYEKNVTSKDAFDDARANMKSARASLEQAEVNLEWASLYSPLNGVLDRRMVDPGEHIDPGHVVMKIVEIDRVKVEFNVPEKDALYFKRGQKVNLTSSNGETRDYVGTVKYVALTAEKATRTYPLKIVVDNPDRYLRPGMIVRASLVRRELENGIAVPFFSLIERERGKSVFVIENGVAREKPVTYGMFQGGMVEITDGLEPGDSLVVVGQRDLVDGAEVNVTDDFTSRAKALVASGADLSSLVMDMRAVK